ncbi:hypothetical protein IWX90DRAFT_203505 [Phyllosticta citrichinensis]|uniref:Uncharacterized protein n=1 Tax=Phyllosticta citrichinensis TaxID=1130410 RepID=A0ABR1XXS9_9PEZI
MVLRQQGASTPTCADGWTSSDVRRSNKQSIERARKKAGADLTLAAYVQSPEATRRGVSSSKQISASTSEPDFGGAAARMGTALLKRSMGLRCAICVFLSFAERPAVSSRFPAGCRTEEMDCGLVGGWSGCRDDVVGRSPPHLRGSRGRQVWRGPGQARPAASDDQRLAVFGGRSVRRWNRGRKRQDDDVVDEEMKAISSFVLFSLKRRSSHS